MRAYLLLIFGVAACATAVILIKSSNSHPSMLAAVRLLLASVLLAPIAYQFSSGVRALGAATIAKAVIPAAALLAIHFISWADGARRAPAANASLIVNLVPVTMPLLTLVFLRQLPRRFELLGTLIALAGVVVLTMPGLRFDPANTRGEITCFFSMLAFACYLLAARSRPAVMTIWVYACLVYAGAGLLCVPVVFALDAWTMPDAREALMLALLAIVPTVIGHSILNASMRTLSPQTVSVFNLGQFLFAGLFAWLMLSETPALRLLPASLLVVIGALTCLGLHRTVRSRRGPHAVVDPQQSAP